MRTTVIRAGRIVAAAAAAVLATGCGTDAAPTVSASASAAVTSPVSFGQEAVQADLDAAVAAAGLPEGRTEAGYPEGGRSASTATGEEGQKLAALVTRLSPCVVSWPSDGTGSSSPLDIVLSGLEERGWEKVRASREVPVGEGGTYFMATYEKQGWTLNARHSSLQTMTQSTVMVTDEACFGRLTDEELALLE